MLRIAQDPDEKLDYTFLWVDELNVGDAITGAAILAMPGLTVTDVSNDATTVTCWLEATAPVKVTCRIMTAAGRKYDRSFLLDIKSL